MLKIAIYGKGGIGKSTTTCNLSAALAERGLRVMQIGCDPKADSTSLLMDGVCIPSILALIRSQQPVTLEQAVHRGFGGVLCAEAGGPTPGTGCAGRGIITAFEKLEEINAYEELKPDVVLYDVLGDVVCGGFAMPLRAQYADYVWIVTSGEKMSLFAARNIAQAVSGFQSRGYAQLGGLILNRRNVKTEPAAVEQLAQEIGSRVICDLPRSETVGDAEELAKTVMEAFPQSEMAGHYRTLADKILEACGHGT